MTTPAPALRARFFSFNKVQFLQILQILPNRQFDQISTKKFDMSNFFFGRFRHQAANVHKRD